MDTAVVVIRIYKKTSCGVISFQVLVRDLMLPGECDLKHDADLVLPPENSKLEPEARKRMGRPTSTDKRVVKLKEGVAEVDARDSASLSSQGGITPAPGGHGGSGGRRHPSSQPPLALTPD